MVLVGLDGVSGVGAMNLWRMRVWEAALVPTPTRSLHTAMADGETQISTEVPDLAFGKDELVSRLDDLLEQYLYTLDAYEKAQQLLTKYLSSVRIPRMISTKRIILLIFGCKGYLDLAKANFTNNTRARYGQDYYDERMQASRRMCVMFFY